MNKAADTAKDATSSFAEVYAKEHQAQPQKASPKASTRPNDHLTQGDKKSAVAGKAKDDKPSVAASGNASPVSKADKVSRADKADKADKTDRVGETDKANDSAPADEVAANDEANVKDADPADEAATAAMPEPALAAPGVAEPQVPTASTDAPLDPGQQPQGVLDPAQLQAVVTPGATDAAEDFDPAADPLADLPMVRMALEQSAKAQGTTSVHAQAQAQDAQTQAASDPASTSTFAESLGLVGEQQKLTDGASDATEEGGIGAISELKSGLGEGSGNRVSDLGGSLSQLSQAVGSKGAAAATPLAQPLNMQQNGWSEGLVNRVMYLSSQNLKSADIQLNPLELGRLDIRVDVTADQQTQISFHSAHLGVRDALESQQGRLRDMLAQQGLSQVDVSVSDQSRQSQQQQQQQAHAQAAQGGGRSGDITGSDGEDAEVSAVAQAAATQSVVGSSLVDYYA
ncbi:flagellar hook-length control protein FliK [Pseudomonas sp. DC3000-4b1]|uniref:flagellar hook-length control protein FliK n=1 Tax=unclassified Pseudomonas TaxID=196821 RepID=UPI003CF89635